MDSGSEITFPGESEQSPDWFAGDIVFVLKVRPHKKFTRKGDDLHTEVRLSIREALLGYTKEITHLDGHIVRLEHDGIT
jgi:DnaJ-class molecular chaperone